MSYPKIILASKSPRRIELLKSIGLKFEVQPSNFAEMVPSQPAHELVLGNACGKARDIARKNPQAIIIGVDTVGAYHHHILEKPKDFADAVRILQILNGTTHEVYSGLCVIDAHRGKELTHVEKTLVTFTKMTDQEISQYIKTGEAMDKAAAFAIQGLGSLFIEKIEGDFYNVVGLPLFRLGRMLEALGVKLL